MSVVRMLIAHRAEARGSRLSRVPRRPPGPQAHMHSRAPRALHNGSASSIVVVFYIRAVHLRRTVYTRHAVSARQVTAVSLVLRTVRRTALSATRRGLSPPRSSFGRGCAGKQCAWAMRGVVSSQRGGGASKLCEQLQLVTARVGAHLTPLRRGSSHLRRSRKIPCAA
jgi:hypothetical protein